MQTDRRRAQPSGSQTRHVGWMGDWVEPSVLLKETDHDQHDQPVQIWGPPRPHTRSRALGEQVACVSLLQAAQRAHTGPVADVSSHPPAAPGPQLFPFLRENSVIIIFLIP